MPDGVIKKIESGELEVIGHEEDRPTLLFGKNKTVGSEIPTIWAEKDFYTTKGSSHVREIFGDKRFPYPKPLEYIVEILRATTKPHSTVLAFFAGSGTTGEAVINLNIMDDGARSFILCTNNQNDICRHITHPRLKTVLTGKREDGSVYSDGLPANLKYYHTAFVPKDEDDLSEALLGHITEMIQLEHGVKLDGQHYIMVLDDDEADALAAHWNEYPDVKALYVSKNVLFTTEQNTLFRDVDIHIIPDYYFNFELREVGETW